MNIPLTPLRFKRRAIQLYGNKLGVVCGESRFSYQEFFERCDRLARALQMLQLGRGSRVAFLAYNCHRLLEAYYGVVQMGAMLIPLNLRLSKNELAFILNDSESRVLFYDSDFGPLVEARFESPCYTGYGLTETSPILTIALPKGTIENQNELNRIRRHSMTGWPIVGVDIKVVDEQGREVEYNARQTGEIIVRSDGVMKGYWKRPVETEMAIRDGWLFTGDMATVDEEGFLQIVDRKKDVIVSGGENIASMEIEQRLYQHDGVLECAVIAIPDAKWGEVPAAFVVLKDGCDTTEEELLQFCRKTLAGYKRPRSVEFMQSLPRGGTGKILKKELRRFINGRREPNS